MAMNTKQKDDLTKLILVAKAIIFDPDRMAQFFDMMRSAKGAIQAVQSVLAVIEQKKPIPPDVAPLLGVSAYMIMVDVAQEATGIKPDTEIVNRVIAQIMATVGKSHAPTAAQPAPTAPTTAPSAPPAPAGGMINQMGA